MVNDAGIDTRLGPALIEAGCSGDSADTYPADVGPISGAPWVSGVTIDRAVSETLEDYVVTKLKGFADSEDQPSTVQLAYELALRRGELQGEGQFLRARLGGETAGIVGYWGGADQLIFQLATRVPFRGRGIARQLLYEVLAEASAQKCSSVIININPEDTPIEWYRWIGFVDEVYWYRSYSFGTAR